MNHQLALKKVFDKIATWFERKIKKNYIKEEDENV